MKIVVFRQLTNLYRNLGGAFLADLLTKTDAILYSAPVILSKSETETSPALSTATLFEYKLSLDQLFIFAESKEISYRLALGFFLDLLEHRISFEFGDQPKKIIQDFCLKLPLEATGEIRHKIQASVSFEEPCSYIDYPLAKFILKTLGSCSAID